MPWTVTQIIEQVSKRTERRADSKIDLRMEFFLGLDEFILENHFWWALKRGSFSTVIGSQIYDLALSAAVNSIQAGGGIPDFGQLDEVIIPTPTGTSTNSAKPTVLTPVFDPAAQLQILQNTIPDAPAAYF